MIWKRIVIYFRPYCPALLYSQCKYDTMILHRFIHNPNPIAFNLSFRRFSLLQTRNVSRIHVQRAVRAEQERQRAVVLHLLRFNAERRERFAELQDEPSAGAAALCQLILQRVPRRPPQQKRSEML